MAEHRCSDCDAPREGRARCSCGSFAAPVPEDTPEQKPKRRYRHWTDLEDSILTQIDRRREAGEPCASWRRVAALLDRTPQQVYARRDKLRTVTETKVNPLIPCEARQRTRPCARCGTPFETTPERRMLCDWCYRHGDHHRGLDEYAIG